MRTFATVATALCLIPLARAQQSPEDALKDRLDNIALQVQQDPTISAPLKAAVAQPAFGAASAGTAGTTGCITEPPKDDDLEKRIEWNRNAATCVGAVARTARIEAARATGPAAVSHQLLAAEMEKAQTDFQAAAAERQGQQTFMGYEWGVGFGASHSFDDVVDDASIVNGIVRVSKDKTTQTRVVLEFHKLFLPLQDIAAGVKSAHGPFFAIAAKSDELISGFGIGWMIGWKDNDDPGDSAAFTVGLGVMVDQDVKSLADDFEEDRPPPAGETEIRFKEETRASALLIVTRTF